jgi:predicted XRE-type DNA-binding protein
MRPRSQCRETGNTGARDPHGPPEAGRPQSLALDIQLQKALASRGPTQAKAAKILRVSQPRVSDLLRGRIDLFSTDGLIDMLARLGVHVRFVLNPARRRVA